MYKRILPIKKSGGSLMIPLTEPFNEIGLKFDDLVLVEVDTHITAIAEKRVIRISKYIERDKK